MAGLVLAKKALPSRAVRVTATGNKGGLRRIDPNSKLVDAKGKGFFSRARQFAGFVLRALGWTVDSISDLWDVTRDIFDTLWYFDWNVSAEEQINRLKAEADAVLLQLAELAGSTVGWATIGAVGMGISIYIPVIGGMALAGMVRNAVIQEAVQDLLGRLTAIGLASTRLIVTQALTWGWIGVRNIYRATVRAGARGIAGARGSKKLEELNEYYRVQDSQPWTFQQKFRRQVEKLPDWLEKYFDAAIDGFQDSFWEGGYVIANELDMAYQRQEQAADLSIKPDAGSDERFYLYGSQQQVMNQTHQLLQQHRVLANRDVGYVVGDTELTGRVPVSARSLKIFFHGVDRPPWMRSDRPKVRSGLVVEHLRNNITWEELKRATLKFTTGSVRVTAFLDNGRQMWVLASTEREGQELLTRLVELSTAEIMRFSAGTQTLVRQTIVAKNDPRNKGKVRDVALMYPAYCYFSRRVKWVDGKDGSPARPDGVTGDGQPYYVKRSRFNLYPDKKPANYPVQL